MIAQFMKSQLMLGLLIFTCLEGVQAGEVSFSKDVLPILQQNCVSCHVTGEELGGLGLAPSLAYKQLVDAPALQAQMSRVKPGKPSESYLLHKLNGTHLDQRGSGGRMPLGFPALPDSQNDVITRWIAAGALDN